MADLEENARRRAAGKKAVVLSSIAIEVVRRIDALFDIERTINGKPAVERRAVRQVTEAGYPLIKAEMLNRLAYPEAGIEGLSPSITDPDGAASRDIAAIAQDS